MKRPHALSAIALVILSLGLNSGCGSSSDEPVVVTPFETCPAESDIGGFQLILKESFTSAQGTVTNGVHPMYVPLVEASDGDCHLDRPKTLFCDPACTSGTTCDDSGECVPLPTNQDLGSVSIDGLSADVEITPIAPVYFYNFVGELPHPAFQAGDDIHLTTSGGDIASFSLATRGVAALEVSQESLLLEAETNASLDWTPTTEDEAIRLQIVLNITNHGGNPGEVICETEDDGHFEIPAALVTALLETGYSGFPSVSLTRVGSNIGNTELGCVDFRAESTVVLPVEIPGLISCSNDDDCPEGQTCQPDLTCR